MATFPISEDTIFLPPIDKPAAQRRKAQRWGSGILEEHQFLRMLCLERKRTERSGNPFMLMLVSGRGLFQSSEGTKAVQSIVQAVAMSTRETDTLGWYEYGNTLAVLFTEIGTPEINSGLIIRKVSTALQHALGMDQFDAVNLTFRVFPDKSHSTPKDEDDDVDLVFRSE